MTFDEFSRTPAGAPVAKLADLNHPLYLELRQSFAGLRIVDREGLAGLLVELGAAENTLRWAAQEANGRVKREIVGGWRHHADRCRAAISRATEK